MAGCSGGVLSSWTGCIPESRPLPGFFGRADKGLSGSGREDLSVRCWFLAGFMVFGATVGVQVSEYDPPKEDLLISI